MTLLDELRNLKTMQPEAVGSDDGSVTLHYHLDNYWRFRVQFDFDTATWAAALGSTSGHRREDGADATWAETALYAQEILSRGTVRDISLAAIEAILAEFRDHLASLGWLVTLIREMGS